MALEAGRALNRVFTRDVLGELMERGTSEVYAEVVRRHVADPETKTNGRILAEIYDHLGKRHRNEYWYKNTLLNLSLGGAQDAGPATALAHVRVAGHIADVVVIGDEGRVYEIKSDLDNLRRLHGQLSAFYGAFSLVSVLVGDKGHEDVVRLLGTFGGMGEAVGICRLTEWDGVPGVVVSREPKRFDDRLRHEDIFKTLRKREYENVIINHFGKLPEATPVWHFTACLREFGRIPIREAQKSALAELRRRNGISRRDFERTRPELRAIVYFAGLSRRLPRLERFLESSYAGA